MTGKLIEVNAELPHLAADHLDVTELKVPVGAGRSERTFDG